MKKSIYFFTVLIIISTAFLANNSADAQGSSGSDTVIMGASYANEVYYSMANGKILASPRNSWDIAFRTKKFSSSILINDGFGVVLYTYPKSDTSGWASVDTSGFAGWTPMYNDPNDWENGAFSRNAKGHPDYGWAIYNDVTHDLVSDSLFIIKLRDGSLRKLWIENKRSVQDIYHFRFANIDGTAAYTDTLDLANDLGTDFVGFSLLSNQRVDFQPHIALWDILFTKYMSIQPNGTPYPVMGVLNNPEIKSKKFHPVPLSYTNWEVNPWDSLISSIGYDWKVLNNQTYTYTLEDSLVFIIQPVNKDVYKLYFTSFAGGSTGVLSFTKEKVLSFGINEVSQSGLSIKVYPNPVRANMNLLVSGKTGDEIHIVLSDLSGRQLGADQPGRLAEGLNLFTFDVAGVNPGLYFMTASTTATKAVTKVIIVR
ncbi:MAG: T9SS type A sorting domain-containing protein [Bacteroidetes bacterium]|nr:T9SS type A sorting domain-containing protein [Bacteroidota bacterium]